MLAAACLLPTARAPAIVAAPRSRNADALDAVLAIVALPAGDGELPAAAARAQRWQELHARATPRAGTVRTTVLANRRHTLAVLGYLEARRQHLRDACRSPGACSRKPPRASPQTLGLAAAPGRAALGRGRARRRCSPRRSRMPSRCRPSALRSAPSGTSGASCCSGADGSMCATQLASARGTNLARWLTALPPNMLDARRLPPSHRATGAPSTGCSCAGSMSGAAARRRQCLPRRGGRQRRSAAPASRTCSYRPARAHGAPRAPDVALVGKGILFDTGGVNLKTHRSMLDMHTDMAGSAVALATLVALAELRAPLAADAWLAITENRIGPHAYKPQEVVRAANGVTIQVIHTDAEGRMVLADTLALAGRTRPRFMLDFATLTGACVYALTERMSGVFTNRPALCRKLLERRPRQRRARVEFPVRGRLRRRPREQGRRHRAVRRGGQGRSHSRDALPVSASCREDIPWAHVDLSSATRSGGLGHVTTDITGFGVRFALELLLQAERCLRALGRAA